MGDNTAVGKADKAEGGAADILLFFPAYNEEATVAGIVRRVPKAVHGHTVRVVVIDDGSSDATASQAALAGAEVVSFSANQGLGAAVRTGLGLSHDDTSIVALAFCDADGEYAPEELERLIAPILDGQADYVVGSRFAGGPRSMRPHRWLGNRTLTVGMKLLARRWGVRGLTDAQSGYRALSSEAARQAEIVHDFNYAQVLTLDLIAKGYRYREVPISYRFRQHGNSFVKLLPYLRRVIPAVWHELRTA